MAQQQLEKESPQATARRGYTLGEWVLIVLDLALGVLGGILLTMVVLSPPEDRVPLFLYPLLAGILVGCFASFLAGICFLVRTRRLASLLQFLGALGGVLLLIGMVVSTLFGGPSPWQAYAIYGSAALLLLAMAYVGKRLADEES